MKKILASLIVLSFASSALAAGTYTENLVNKVVSPVAQKEAQLKAKHDAAVKAQKEKQEAAKKAQEQKKKEMEAAQKAQQQKIADQKKKAEAARKAQQDKVNQKKKGVEAVKTDVKNLMKF